MKREETKNEDGSVTVETSFTLGTEEVRPLRDDVVEAMDEALNALGGELMHMIDPARLVDFPAPCSKTNRTPMWFTSRFRSGER